jgi:HK97 family phage portal protein
MEWLKKALNYWKWQHQDDCFIYNHKIIIKENIIKETMKNSVAISCINYLSRCIHSFEITHDFHKYFNNNIYNFLEEILLEWLFHGNCFIELENNCWKVLKTTEITYYNKKFYYKHRLLKNFIHLKNYHPWDHEYGISPLDSVINHIIQYNNINNYLNNVAHRGGITSGIIISKQPLTNESRQKLQDGISDFYKNGNSQGTIMVLEGDFSWTSIAVSPHDLDIKKLNNYNGSAIARGLGIHPVLIGLDKRSYGGFQYSEIRKQFTQDTLKPLYNKIIEQLLININKIYGYNITININYNNIYK